MPALVLAAALALAGCATHSEPPATASGPSFPVTVTPSGGKPVSIAAQPQHIVSLSPASTEDLFAIGAGPQVTAVDKLSDYPSSAPRSDIDAFKPNVEAIAAKKPDLVIVYDDTNNVVAGLTQLKIPVLLLKAASSLDDAYGQISLLGKATGHQSEADRLVGDMKAQITDVVAKTPRKSLSYFHELSADGYTVTSKTFVGQVYGLFGLHNIADAAGGAGDYPQLSAEKVIAANPNLIFLADTVCCQQNASAVAARPGWGSLHAVQAGNVVALDDSIASRWGPRVVDFARAVAAAVQKAG
ncbi:iron complex transport system substrate-binding protein [Kutzneria buriramensis]|uniref:Iron complex transport system substrate-binding protein n=2 Tax=Kutzneria buriramensis TaxID=1045776 RepID=A0A3E0HZX0_9PSEU|nr:iron complex transport system substrate-binding protein [Kutzneria buriramensis]